jgi:hypothetical protein
MRVAVTLIVAIAVARLVDPDDPKSRSLDAPEPAPDPARRIRITRIELPDNPPKPVPVHRRSTPREPVERMPAPAPPPVPEPPPPPTPQVVVPDADAVRRGQSLLDTGTFPRLRATYARIGFPSYRDAMVSLGGRFFLYDGVRRRPLAEIDPRTGAILGESLDGALSRWPRDVTRHLDFALEHGRAVYGSAASRVILLPPARVDAALLGSVEGFARGLGLDPSEIVRLDLAYEIREGRLRCEVISVALRAGTERDLSLHVDLSGIRGVS